MSKSWWHLTLCTSSLCRNLELPRTFSQNSLYILYIPPMSNPPIHLKACDLLQWNWKVFCVTKTQVYQTEQLFSFEVPHCLTHMPSESERKRSPWKLVWYPWELHQQRACQQEVNVELNKSQFHSTAYGKRNLTCCAQNGKEPFEWLFIDRNGQVILIIEADVLGKEW